MGCILGLGGCGGPQCDNEAFFGLPSSDGASIAYVFHRRCGVNPAVTTDVTVFDFHGVLRNEPGNALEVAGEQPVRVFWRAPKTLVVIGFADPIYRRNPTVGSITVEYRPSGGQAR